VQAEQFKPAEQGTFEHGHAHVVDIEITSNGLNQLFEQFGN